MFQRIILRISQKKIYIEGIDFFSKKVFAIGILNKEANTIVDALDQVFNHWNVYPSKLQSDNGGEFVNDIMTDWAKQHNVKLIRTNSYTPQSNGLVENWNLYLRNMMRESFIRTKSFNWIDNLQDFVDNRNKSKHSVTKNQPEQIWDENKDFTNDKIDEVKTTLSNNAQKQLDRNKTQEFNFGDTVRVKTSSLSSKIRKQIKAGDTKNIIVKYSTKLYTISKTVKSRKDFSKNRYYLKDKKGNNLLAEIKLNNPNKDRKPKAFFASELLLVRSDQKTNLTTDESNKLNRLDVEEDEVEDLPIEKEKAPRKKAPEIIERAPSTRIRKNVDRLNL